MNKSQSFNAAFKPAAMAISKEHEHLDTLIQGYGLSWAPSQLELIFKQQGILPYYEHAVKEATVNAIHYLDSVAIPSSWFDCALNAYEGAIWEELPSKDIPVLLTACLFYRVKNPLYELKLVDGSIPERVMNAMQRKSLIDTLNKPRNKGVDQQLAMIACDAAMMQTYMRDAQLIQHFSGVWTSIQEERYMEGRKPMAADFFLQEQVRIHRSYVWKTRWARKKALQLNHPQRVQHMKSVMAKTIPTLTTEYGND